MSRGTFSANQTEVLLKAINRRRVGQKQGQSHVEAYDIRAHLSRMFGFGNWDFIMLETELLFDVERQLKNNKPGRYVAYRVTVRLSVRDEHGYDVAIYDGTAVGSASMPDYMHAEAHDMAVKTAESQALKRAAINLGDQFGLSLYNGGSTEALVRRVVTFQVEEVTATNHDLTDDVPEIKPEQHDVGLGAEAEEAIEQAEELFEEIVNEEMITKAQIPKLAASLGRLGLTSRDDRINKINEILGTSISSSKELTKRQASTVIDELEKLS